MDMIAVENARQAALLLCRQAGFEAAAADGFAAQFVQEKGWAWWQKPEGNFNIGNVQNNGVVVFCQTMDEGLTLYLQTLRNGFYNSVIQAAEAGNAEGVAQALAVSPWADPPYGETLLILFREIAAAVPDENTSALNPLSLADLADHPVGVFGPALDERQRWAAMVVRAQEQYHYSYFEMAHNPIGALQPETEMVLAQRAAGVLWRLGVR